MIRGHMKPMVVMLVVASLIVGGVFGFQLFKNRMIAQSIKGQANPPQTVSTAVAQASLWQPSVEAVGSLIASRQAALSAEVAGLVTAIEQGSMMFYSLRRDRADEAGIELRDAAVVRQRMGDPHAVTAFDRQGLGK